MRILKEVECSVDLNGEEVRCLIFVYAFYAINQKFGTHEAWLEEIEIDEILSLEDSPSGPINQRDVTNIPRLKDYLYDKILDSSSELSQEDVYNIDTLDYYDELKKDWN